MSSTDFYEDVKPDKGSSFKAARYDQLQFMTPRHIHPEYEIMLILESDGLCFCGDSSTPYYPGSIMVFSKSLPHFVLADKRFYHPDSSERCKSIYIQFREELLPADYRNMPGFQSIKHMLESAERGLYFAPNTIPNATHLITQLPDQEKFEKLINLYSLLNLLGNSNQGAPITTINYKKKAFSDDHVFNRTVEYINHHYFQEFTLSDIANHVGMNKSALCRHFKKISGKQIFKFVNEFRISYVCKKMLNSDKRISDIAYECGFNNIPYFNITFKEITGYTPSEYRKINR